MFTKSYKKDPMIDAIKSVLAESGKQQEAVDRTNSHFKVTNKAQLPHDLRSSYDAMVTENLGKKTLVNEAVTVTQAKPEMKTKVSQADVKSVMGKLKVSLREETELTKDFVINEAVSNLLEKDSITESEYNIIMESEFGQAFIDARMAGKETFDWNGKKYNSRKAGEDESEWKAAMAKNSGPPIPEPRRADRMPSTLSPNVELDKNTEVFGKVEPPAISGISNPVPGTINLNGTPIKAGKGQTVSEPTDVNQVVPGATPAAGFTDPKRTPWEPSWVQNQGRN